MSRIREYLQWNCTSSFPQIRRSLVFLAAAFLASRNNREESYCTQLYSIPSSSTCSRPSTRLQSVRDFRDYDFLMWYLFETVYNYTNSWQHWTVHDSWTQWRFIRIKEFNKFYRFLSTLWKVIFSNQRCLDWTIIRKIVTITLISFKLLECFAFRFKDEQLSKWIFCNFIFLFKPGCFFYFRFFFLTPLLNDVEVRIQKRRTLSPGYAREFKYSLV